MSSLVQRLALTASMLDARYAALTRWMTKIWQADKQGYERLVLQRLNPLINCFAENNLLIHPTQKPRPVNSLKAYSEWPQFTRKELQEMFQQLQTLYNDDRGALHYQSGGSTGEPTHLFRLKTIAIEERLSAYHMLLLLGWKPGTLRVCLWGSDSDLGLIESQKRGLKSFISKELIRVMAFGGYAPDDSLYAQFLQGIVQNPGCAVYGYTGLLDECANYMLKNNKVLKPGAISAIWCTAEMLHNEQRATFLKAFGIEVRDFYGSRECPWLAAECEKGLRHINPRYFVETVDAQGRALPAGEIGELAVTDLFNHLTPLLRYLIGDMGIVEWRKCDCGRSGLVLTELAGRVNDVIRLPSGRYFSSVFFPQVIKQYPGIQKSQLARLGSSSFDVRYIGNLTKQLENEIADLVSKICEGAEVTVRQVDNIKLTRQGKLVPFVDESEQASTVDSNDQRISKEDLPGNSNGQSYKGDKG